MARITSQYGDVYLLATDASACRSSLESPIVNGLFLGIRDTAPLMQAYQITSRIGLRHTSSYLRIDILSVLIFGLFGVVVYEVLKAFPDAKNAPQIGQRAPEFSLADANGKNFTLAPITFHSNHEFKWRCSRDQRRACALL